ncbi:MAG: HAMP domain-containing protein [Nannocystis sp.]|nr:ATP-binding protein [Nannocystis sp.]MBA3546028.1 HAMP domain-containing protein [Nannocystis sp.]
MSLRARYVIAISAITLVTLGGAFAYVSISVNASQRRQLDLALAHEAREEAAEAAMLGGDELAISDRPGPAANDVGPLTKYGVIYGPAGAVLAQTPSWRGRPPLLPELPERGGSAFDLWSGDEHLRGIHVDIPAHPGATMLLAAPRSDLDGDERFLVRAMATVFGLALLWTLLVAIVVVWRLTRDHRTIAVVARRVAAGDFDARIRMLSGDREVVQLAQDIDAMIDHLGVLIGLQQRFIANAAHELRSPLTTLYGELSHALRRSREPAEYERAIQEALGATQRLRRLTDDLLAVARVRADADTSEVVELADLCQEAASLVAADAEARKVEVRQHGTDLRVPGRREDLLRLLRNLLENAVRHSPAGGVVHLRCEQHGGHVELTVRDQGPGVAEVDRDKLFEAFYRGARERAANDGGTGLGLTIAREIALAHGGELGLVRLLEGDAAGACFLLKLPTALA